MKRSTRGVRIVKDRLEEAISNERILVCVFAWESRHSSNQPSSTGLPHVGPDHDDARNFHCRRRQQHVRVCVVATQAEGLE